MILIAAVLWWGWRFVSNSGHDLAMKTLASQHVSMGKEQSKNRESRLKPLIDLPSPSQTPASATRISDLPFMGRCYSADPAVQEALGKDLEGLYELNKALLEARMPDRGTDFKKLALALGFPNAAQMSVVEAAAAFLKHMEKFKNLLTAFKSDLAMGPWNWVGAGNFSNDFMVANSTMRMLVNYSKPLSSLTEAALLTGDSTTAWGNLQVYRQMAERGAERGNVIGGIIGVSILRFQNNLLQRGIAQEQWSDGQLREAAEGKTAPSVLSIMRTSFAGEAAQISRNCQDRETLRNSIRENGTWLVRSGLFPISDQQIDDSSALIQADQAYYLAQFGEDGRFHPPPAGSQSPSSETMDKANFLELAYFYPFSIGGDQAYQNLVNSAVEDQSTQDMSRIEAGMEIYRRQHGEYPPSLEELAPEFPGGVPVDPATGQPYTYRPTAEGYTLLGTGRDQVLHEGNEALNVVRHVKLPENR